ncbi:MAG: hypothetical protein B1H12_04635 [Desulfobacteraceae bacterium 4484_190.2]|nr:MAG: hypothetical protein B1H12_04635 [Desulfobacteraceae bacterium 4484_190.2]
MYQDFDEIAVRARELGPKRAVILFPNDADVMQAAAEGMKEGLITPVLVGEEASIKAIASETDLPSGAMEIIHQEDPQEAANLCLDMVIRGEAGFVVKGNILTTYLYRALINATKILAPDQIPCTLCFHQVQGINKIFVVTDPGINIRPDLTAKKKILANAVQMLRSLGCDNPTVMALAAKLLDGSASVFARDAQELSRLGDKGKFGPCTMEAATTLFDIFDTNNFQADLFPDIFLVPNIETGNILVKTIDHLIGGIRQCVTVGAGLIILTPSRSDGYEVRMGNLALGLVLAESCKRD